MCFLHIFIIFSNISFPGVYWHQESSDSKSVEVASFKKQDVSKDTDMWLYYDMGGDTSLYYSWVNNYESELDTYMVWFEPPAPCSVLGGYVVVRNIYDSLTAHVFEVFVARLNQKIGKKSYDEAFNSLDSPDWFDYKLNGNPQNPVTEPLISSIYYSVVDTIFPGSNTIIHSYINLPVPMPNGDSIFGIGWVKKEWPSDTLGPNAAFMMNLDGASLPTHSVVHSSQTGLKGWYRWYTSSDGIPFHIYAHIKFYGGPNLFITQWDELGNTYSTLPRDVYLEVVQYEANGYIDSVFLYYSLNSSGIWNVKYSDQPVSGDSIDGHYHFVIPGASVGDTVYYYFKAKNTLGDSIVNGIFNYVIKSGRPGYGLYITDGNTDFATDILMNLYKVDVWNVAEDGYPDSSVFAFYTSGKGAGKPVIIWNAWGAREISIYNYGCDYSTFAESVYIKEFLDAGDAGFWLIDQDLGYSLLNDLFFDFGTHEIPQTSWVNSYLGIVKLTDDDTSALSGKDSFRITGDSLDPIVGPLFRGVGLQPKGFLHHYTPGCTPSWVGYFDSLKSDVVVDLISESGYKVSMRRENIGSNGNSKAVLQTGYFSYIYDPSNPFDIDTLAADSFVIAYADYFGLLGADKPGECLTKTFKIFQPLPSIVSKSTTLRLNLPYKSYINIYATDVAGRVVKEIFRGKMEAGLNAIDWNVNTLVPGTYFIVYQANGAQKGVRKVVVIK